MLDIKKYSCNDIGSLKSNVSKALSIEGLGNYTLFQTYLSGIFSIASYDWDNSIL